MKEPKPKKPRLTEAEKEALRKQRDALREEHVCETCGVSYPTEGGLKGHRRTMHHTDEVPRGERGGKAGRAEGLFSFKRPCLLAQQKIDVMSYPTRC